MFSFRGNPEGVKLLAVVVVFLTLAIIAVALRVWARRIKRAALQLNDYYIFLALVLALLVSYTNGYTDTSLALCNWLSGGRDDQQGH